MLQDSHRIDVSLEPLDEYLVIQPSSDETETRAGLILPASAAAAARVPHRASSPRSAPDVTGIEPGDKVLYPREAGYEVRLGGIEVKVVKRDDLIARVHDCSVGEPHGSPTSPLLGVVHGSTDASPPGRPSRPFDRNGLRIGQRRTSRHLRTGPISCSSPEKWPSG